MCLSKGMGKVTKRDEKDTGRMGHFSVVSLFFQMDSICALRPLEPQKDSAVVGLGSIKIKCFESILTEMTAT